jgi:hypothetical protein
LSNDTIFEEVPLVAIKIGEMFEAKEVEKKEVEKEQEEKKKEESPKISGSVGLKYWEVRLGYPELTILSIQKSGSL